MTTDTLPTQSAGHSMTLAWIVIWPAILTGVFVFGICFEAAIFFLFG